MFLSCLCPINYSFRIFSDTFPYSDKCVGIFSVSLFFSFFSCTLQPPHRICGLEPWLWLIYGALGLGQLTSFELSRWFFFADSAVENHFALVLVSRTYHDYNSWIEKIVSEVDSNSNSSVQQTIVVESTNKHIQGLTLFNFIKCFGADIVTGWRS